MRSIVSSSRTQQGIERIRRERMALVQMDRPLQIEPPQPAVAVREVRPDKPKPTPIERHQHVFIMPPAIEPQDVEDEMPQGRRIRARDVVRVIAWFHGVTVEEILGPRRTRQIVMIRNHAIYEIARLCPHMTASAIGRFLGRDHTTILYALSSFHDVAERHGVNIQPLGRSDLMSGGSPAFRQRMKERMNRYEIMRKSN